MGVFDGHRSVSILYDHVMAVGDDRRCLACGVAIDHELVARLLEQRLIVVAHFPFIN
jgi:hypothetical protein